MLFNTANDSAMGVTTITANTTMTAFIVLSAIEFAKFFFILAFIAELTLCHPRQ